MMLGLKRGTVCLAPHQDLWDQSAKEVISLLWSVLDGIVIDIQHIGSTSIQQICAKPIIDIVVGMKNIDDILPFIPSLAKQQIIFRRQDQPEQYLFVMGDFELDTRTHHIHVVNYYDTNWNNYINFRDYLNSHPERADEYNTLKLDLAQTYANDRIAYTHGKEELIDLLLAEAAEWRQTQL